MAASSAKHKLLKTYSFRRRSAPLRRPPQIWPSGARTNGAAGLSPGRNHVAVDVADALHPAQRHGHIELPGENVDRRGDAGLAAGAEAVDVESEEHTSELQSRQYLVCRLLLEKKKKERFGPYRTRPSLCCRAATRCTTSRCVASLPA